MHTIYYGTGMALCGIALIMILVAFMKKKKVSSKENDG